MLVDLTVDDVEGEEAVKEVLVRETKHGAALFLAAALARRIANTL